MKEKVERGEGEEEEETKRKKRHRHDGVIRRIGEKK